MKKILIFYSYFTPAFRAGGPVQSLNNLVNALHEEFEFYILCSAFDIGRTTVLPGINPNCWNDAGMNIKVCHLTKPSFSEIRRRIVEVDPYLIYINGFFSTNFSTIPLYLGRVLSKKVVFSPRGMVQEGALKIKPLKKKLFFGLLKLSGIHKNVLWHATDTQESNDITRLFGSDANVLVASNIPRKPVGRLPRVKDKGKVTLVYLSLISEKKCLHILLQALEALSADTISCDIYGPVKDESYWTYCQTIMRKCKNVRYGGEVLPGEVPQVLAKYHAFVLPTKGENFGHAIFDAFSVGTPALLSPYTPWGLLQEKNAGVTVESFKIDDWSRAIEFFRDLDQAEFEVMSDAAYTIARSYFADNDFREHYIRLFN